MVDLYTKGVLTVIAAALVAIVLQNNFGTAHAQGSGCGGSVFNACYVRTGLNQTVAVSQNLRDVLDVRIVP